MQNKRLGLFYIIVGTLFIADLVYLYFFSYDGEIFPMILFPMSLFAIAFIFKGFLVVFSSPSPSNQVITTTNQIKNPLSGIGSKALKSNVVVLPLIFILGAIILDITGSNDGLEGLVLVWFGGVAAAIYFTLTVIIYTFSSNGTDSSPQSNKRVKTGFKILFAFTLFLTIASLIDYQILKKENAIQDGYKVVRTFSDNLAIGSPLEVLVDVYKKNTDYGIELYDIAEGPTREAFRSCGSDVKSNRPRAQGEVSKLYYMDEVLVLKFLPGAVGSNSGSIEYDTRIITFNDDNTVTICNENIPNHELFYTLEIYADRNVKLIPVKIQAE